MWSGLKRVFLWDYPRASWQYDIIVAAIVAFVFLTPRDWFRDQPRVPHSHEVTVLPSLHGSSVFWIDPQLLASVPVGASEQARFSRIAEILKKEKMMGHQQVITQLDPVYDSEHELTGYMAVAKP
jgi:hypothetical protein